MTQQLGLSVRSFSAPRPVLFATLTLLCLALSYADLSHAGQYMYHPGSMATTGNTTLSKHLLSVTHNPAACSKVLRKSDRFRMSYLGNAGFSVELGQVDNFEDEINDLVDLLESDVTSLDEANEQANRFNAVLEEMARSGYIKTSWDVFVPAFPMAFRMDSLGGNVCLEANATAQIRGAVLNADGIEYDEVSNDFLTESSLYIKSAVQTHFSVTFSRSVWQRRDGHFPGALVVGGKIKAYQLALSKQVIPFESFEDEDVSDVISDEYDQNQNSTSAIGVDVGALWDGGRYQVGFTLANVVEPSFEYGVLGTNCSASTGTRAFENCQVAANFVTRGDINGREKHTMHTVPTVDASFAIFSNWFIAGSADLVAYNDAVGDELQWRSLTTSFMPKTRWIPGFRVGYRENTAGEALSQVTFGTTLLGVFNLDFLYGLDKIEIDDETYPRTFALNFGFEQHF
ncbi:MAG: conjugal transfer protein TraF [Gammaproteobacteria bacterium]